ncbi:MAG: tetratricopeptide repeat protein [Deltaproteobacteria bacterium]|nr:tetratricopeptide repeat protein [Deltaproteobacteria bacterium]
MNFLQKVICTSCVALSVSCAGNPQKQVRRSQVERFFSGHSHDQVHEQAQQQKSLRYFSKENSYFYYVLSELDAFEGHTLEGRSLLEKAIALHPSSSFLQLELAQHSIESNQVSEAFEAAQKAVELDPKNTDAHLLLGKLLAAKKESEKAIAQYETVIQLLPKDDEAYSSLVREYLAQKKNAQALEVLARLKKANPESSIASLYSGLIYASSKSKKDISKAIEAFKNVLETSPEDSRALQALGQLYVDEGKNADALRIYETLANLNPSDLSIQVRLGLLYYEKRDYKLAIEVFKKVLARNPSADRIQYYLGILYQNTNDDTEALKYFAQVPAESTYYKDAVLRQVLILQQRAETEKSLKLIQEALAKKESVSEFYDVYANILIAQKKMTAAVEVLEKAIQKFPKEDRLQFSLGVAYDKQGNFEKSVQTMREVIQTNPKNASALNYMAYTFAEKGIYLDEALKYAHEAVLLRPKDGFILDSLGWVYYKKGDFVRAFQNLQKAILLNPGEPTILEHIGDVFAILGERTKAVVYYKKAFEFLQAKQIKDQEDEEDLARLKKKFSHPLV